MSGRSNSEDDRVTPQGFYWAFYRHGHAQHFPHYGAMRWHDIDARAKGVYAVRVVGHHGDL
ncbi:MAG: hypothetical protein HY941_01875 [Gammaproteobacteria bacterium]|nr:hypothetical protein [Gammaproteobacteria bacterium]